MSELPLYSTARAHGSALRRALGREVSLCTCCTCTGTDTCTSMYMYLVYMCMYVGTRSECLGDACSCMRVLALGGGGSESSESSDGEYTCKEESAVAPLFLINNRDD